MFGVKIFVRNSIVGIMKIVIGSIFVGNTSGLKYRGNDTQPGGEDAEGLLELYLQWLLDHLLIVRWSSSLREYSCLTRE